VEGRTAADRAGQERGAKREEDKRRRNPPYLETIKIDDEGAYLHAYEVLINPPKVESEGACMAVEKVKHSSRTSLQEALGKPLSVVAF